MRHLTRYLSRSSSAWVCLGIAMAILSACGWDEAVLDDVREVAEVDVDPVAVEVSPQGATVIAEVKLEDPG